MLCCLQTPLRLTVSTSLLVVTQTGTTTIDRTRNQTPTVRTCYMELLNTSNFYLFLYLVMHSVHFLLTIISTLQIFFMRKHPMLMSIDFKPTMHQVGACTTRLHLHLRIKRHTHTHTHTHAPSKSGVRSLNCGPFEVWTEALIL